MNETDPTLAKCVGYLHGSGTLRRGDPVPLQYVLEEALKVRFGVVKDHTDLVQSCLREDEKGGSNSDELELDLLKEDLMCVVCNGMDVGARNRLLECSGCHSLYHQECHKPEVTEDDPFDDWTCHDCKANAPIGPAPNLQTAPPIDTKETGKKIKLASTATASNKSPKSSSYRHSSYKYSKK